MRGGFPRALHKQLPSPSHPGLEPAGGESPGRPHLAGMCGLELCQCPCRRAPVDSGAGDLFLWGWGLSGYDKDLGAWWDSRSLWVSSLTTICQTFLCRACPGSRWAWTTPDTLLLQAWAAGLGGLPECWVIFTMLDSGNQGGPPLPEEASAPNFLENKLMKKCRPSVFALDDEAIGCQQHKTEVLPVALAQCPK